MKDEGNTSHSDANDERLFLVGDIKLIVTPSADAHEVVKLTFYGSSANDRDELLVDLVEKLNTDYSYSFGSPAPIDDNITTATFFHSYSGQTEKLLTFNAVCLAAESMERQSKARKLE